MCEMHRCPVVHDLAMAETQTIWHLFYPDGKVARRHYQTLKHDAHISRVDCVDDPATPNGAYLDVAFLPGHRQPSNKALRHLPARYPTVEVEGSIEVVEALPSTADSFYPRANPSANFPAELNYMFQMGAKPKRIPRPPKKTFFDHLLDDEEDKP